MIKSQKKWDIFCKIVDNFGDIGICWRLARQLQCEHDLQIRLFVDDLASAAKILKGISNTAEQSFEDVTVMRWDDDTVFDFAADVVIESFACGLPPAYIAKMHTEMVWVNVDYLSAESWVSEFHALNGRHQESNLTRHFYFPGFNENTGGLIREQDLITRRDAFQQTTVLQKEFWQPLNIDAKDSELNISLFSYPNAPIDALLQSLLNGDHTVNVYLPLNSCLPTQLLGNRDLAVGDCLTVGALNLHILPFLSQDDYDRLLWACDINFVRGEDSWVRAIWAGKPFIWQPYWQEDNAHLVKLNAFLDTFYNADEFKETVAKLHRDWSIEAFSIDVWQRYLNSLEEIKVQSLQQSKGIIKQDALVGKLVAFCANLAK